MEALQDYINSKINIVNEYGLKKLSMYTKEELIDIFKSCYKQLSPIYGSQKQSALKLLKWSDRDCIILEYKNRPIGILAFKNSPIHEESSIQTKNWYLEIKSLFLFEQHDEGHIWKLRDILLKELENYKNIDGILVSVSKNKAPWSFNMFRNIGFNPLYEVYNKYKTDWDSEVYLYYPLHKNLLSKNRILTLKEPYFSQLSSCKKTVEWRSGKNFEYYKIGDVITFINWNKQISKKIANIIKYSSLEEYIENEWLENILPWIKTKEDAVRIYEWIPGYKEKIKKYGIIAFKF